MSVYTLHKNDWISQLTLCIFPIHLLRIYSLKFFTFLELSSLLASQRQIHSFYNLEKNDSHIAVGKLVGQVRSGKWEKKNDLWTLIRDQGLGILDSTLWIPDCRGGFQSQSVELGFWIPLFCGIPDSKALDFGFHKHSGIWIPLHRAISE